MLYRPAIFFLLVLSPFFLGLKPRTESPDFEVTQDNKTIKLTKAHTEIVLDKKPFWFSFNSKAYDENKRRFYATQIAFVADSANLEKVKPGMSSDSLPFFANGTGLAGAQDYGPYPEWYISDEANHYIIYSKNGPDKRALLVSEKGNILRLRCEVAAVHGEETGTNPLAETKIKNLYVVLFNDMNLDNYLDKEEFRTLIIRFKQ